jgi:prepilin-type N-terminal cleavage/methylation domain-containing protein
MMPPIRLKNNAGFTLSEIITVIIIIGITASLALPRFNNTFERMRASEGVQILTALLGAQRAYEFENGAYATNPNLLDVTIDRSSNFLLPPTVDNPGNPANPIARIRRIGGGGYWLQINEEGTIDCTNQGDNPSCAQAGY